MMEHGILDDVHNVVEATMQETWAWCADSAEWIVGKTEIGPYEVSTVFLRINHQYGDGPPLWFETMVFGSCDGPMGDYEERYSTWAEAVAGHAKVCQLVQDAAKEGGA